MATHVDFTTDFIGARHSFMVRFYRASPQAYNINYDQSISGIKRNSHETILRVDHVIPWKQAVAKLVVDTDVTFICSVTRYE